MINSFLIEEPEADASWHATYKKVIQILEEGTVIQRQLYETTGSYAVMRPAERSDAKLDIRFKGDNKIKGYRSIELRYLNGSQQTIRLMEDLGMPEGVVHLGRMEDESTFRGRLHYIASVLRSLTTMRKLPCSIKELAENAATIIRHFQSSDEGSIQLQDGTIIDIRSGPRTLIYGGKINSPPGIQLHNVELNFPRDCPLGRSIPILIRAQVIEGILSTQFYPQRMSGRGSTSPIDAMSAIAEMAALNAP